MGSFNQTKDLFGDITISSVISPNRSILGCDYLDGSTPDHSTIKLLGRWQDPGTKKRGGENPASSAALATTFC
jgi:hypothetical protein